MVKDVLVLGAGFAGIRSAVELAQRGHDVTLMDLRENHEFTPGIIDVIRGRVPGDRLQLDIEGFVEGTGIDFEQEAVEGIIPGEHKVVTGSDQYSYDSLVVALGAEPQTFGMDISGVHGMYSLEAAEELEEDLEDAGNALVVGSGYVGIETAGELEARGLEVRVVDRSTRPMPNSPEKASHLVLDYIQDRDIRFTGGKTVVEVDEGTVETEDGEEFEADVVVWAGGIQASSVVQNSFDCGPEGVAVNSGLSSEKYPDVFAAGDSADTGIVKTAHTAIDQGELVAHNLEKGEGEELERYEPGNTPLVVSIGRTGLFMYGERVLQSRLFRYLKDMIRLKYFLRLRFEGLKARYL